MIYYLVEVYNSNDNKRYSMGCYENKEIAEKDIATYKKFDLNFIGNEREYIITPVEEIPQTLIDEDKFFDKEVEPLNTELGLAILKLFF